MGIFRRLITPTGEVEAFVFTIQTTTSNQSFELPVYSFGGVQPNISVDWDDSSTSTITSETDSARLHTFTSAGTYTIAVTGVMPAFKVDNNPLYRTLYKSVVHWGTTNVKLMNFYGASNLTSLPNSGGIATNNQGLNTLINADNFMRNTGITSIPSGLFDFAINITSFVDSFSFINITSIPSGLFDNCTQVTTFNSTFNQCFNLASIPPNLFDNNTSVVNFSSTFKSCISIASIPSGLFDNNTSVVTFFSLFRMPTTSNSLSGNAPTLWTRVPEPLGTYAFRNCTGLTNYASIPANWK